ncbi:unnamed protein product, partial [Brassica rapa subsp. narinosa]
RRRRRSSKRVGNNTNGSNRNTQTVLKSKPNQTKSIKQRGISI